MPNFQNLKREFTCEVVLPGDSNYDEVSTTMAAKGSPAVVLLPKTADEVAKAILFAKDNSIILSVRSGGHGVSGFGTNNGGVVINLSRMNKIELIDETARIVKIGVGAKWIEVAEKIQPYGLAISSGDTKSVGVGGLTLGGGIGWMVRKFGLTIDSLVAAEIVTADGKILRLSKTENPDLFWAIKGGGGNFGVVTNFEIMAHPIKKVYSGDIVYTLDNFAQLLKSFRDYMRTVDENLTTILNLIAFDGNPPMLINMVCYAGEDETKAKQAIDPLLKIGKTVSNNIQWKNYSEVLGDAHPPKDIKVVVNNVLVDNFSDEIIDTIADIQSKTPNFILQIRALGAALNKIESNETAFAHRNAEAMLLSPTFVSPTASELEIEQALQPWQRIAKYGNGSYVQFVSNQTPENMLMVYPQETLKRLLDLKKIYDPTNLFNQNFNIVS